MTVCRCHDVSIYEVNHLGPTLRRFVDEECCLDMHPEKLTDLANLAMEEGRLVWTLLGTSFVYGIRLPEAEGYKCFYYVHLRHHTNRNKSRNLYIHSIDLQGALQCLEYLMRLDETELEYISISCLESRANLILPLVPHTGRAVDECLVNHPLRKKSLPFQLLQRIVDIYPKRWMVLTKLQLDNTASRFLAQSRARLSLNAATFEDGGETFIRSYVEADRTLRGVRFCDSPFQLDELFSEFFGLCGQSRYLETIQLVPPIPYKNILGGLSQAIRQSKSIRSLHLGWPKDNAPEKYRLIQSTKKDDKLANKHWVGFTRAVMANRSLLEFSFDVYQHQARVTEQRHAARIFLSMEVAKMLKCNPRIQRVPYQSELFDWQIWKALVAPILRGEYHRRLIESLHHQHADDLRAALVGRVVSQLVAPNPGLVYKCLELHTDIVVQYL